MIIDYVGQELIWELMCNHPYHKNFLSFSITIWRIYRKSEIEGHK